MKNTEALLRTEKGSFIAESISDIEIEFFFQVAEHLSEIH